jgi:hypothetical protein
MKSAKRIGNARFVRQPGPLQSAGGLKAAAIGKLRRGLSGAPVGAFASDCITVSSRGEIKRSTARSKFLKE